MNICQVIWDIDSVGGAEQMVVNIVQGFRVHYPDVEISVISICGSGKGLFSKKLNALGIDVYYLGEKLRAFNPNLTYRLLKSLKSLNADIIHSHIWGASFHSLICGKILNIPVIVHEHNVLDRQSFYHNLFDRFLFGLRSLTLACSNKVKLSICKYLKPCNQNLKRIEVLNNCINTNAFSSFVDKKTVRQNLGLSPEDFLFVNIASLTKQKSQDLLIESFGRLAVRYPKMKLLIVGTGPLYDYLHNMALQNCPAGSVVFAKMRSDIPDILNASDIFILPSLWEGLPLVLLEAMYMGCPVIATDVGEVGKVLSGNGYLIQPNCPKQLEDAMEKGFKDFAKFQMLCPQAKQTVISNFSMESYSKSLMGIYVSKVLKKVS